MMDLLIQVTTSNKINPGGHVIQVINDRSDDFLYYKPSTPIGEYNKWENKISSIEYSSIALRPLFFTLIYINILIASIRVSLLIIKKYIFGAAWIWTEGPLEFQSNALPLSYHTLLVYVNKNWQLELIAIKI